MKGKSRDDFTSVLFLFASEGKLSKDGDEEENPGREGEYEDDRDEDESEEEEGEEKSEKDEKKGPSECPYRRRQSCRIRSMHQGPHMMTNKRPTMDVTRKL